MLTWLKNSEKNIASTAIAIFVGSWLLLFCQTCFASLQNPDSTSYSKNETVTFCHTIDNETEKLKKQCNFGDDHCSGVCDYDEITASLNSVEKTAHSDKFHKKLSIDNIPVSISFKDKTASSLKHHRLPIPERAILLPLQRYVVFLI